MMGEATDYDFIIAGQGIAGSLLAYFLIKKGVRILIVDEDPLHSSSKIAAGIINPVTGHRFVKSWMFEELRAFNDNFYPQLEKELGQKFYAKTSILRFIHFPGDVNQWYSRSTLAEFENYIKLNADLNGLEDKLRTTATIGEIQNAAQVNMAGLIQALKNRFKNENALWPEVFDYEQLEVFEESIAYKGVSAKKVIFCEGQKSRFNPFFNYLPFEPAKGEILILKIPELKPEMIIKDKLTIAPLGNDLYWCGSNYEWNPDNELPTPAVREEFEIKLRRFLKINFEVVNHLAAIRPTVKDRRPFLGLHPEFGSLAIFNGLGTKGASLCPYWANHFSDFLLQKNSLDAQVDIARFDLDPSTHQS